MSYYNSDMINADLDEMAIFLQTAKQIEGDLEFQIYDIRKKFESIKNWDDDIHDKTSDVLEAINKKCDIVFDEIDRLNNEFEHYVNDLNDYNDPYAGKLGRL